MLENTIFSSQKISKQILHQLENVEDLSINRQKNSCELPELYF